MYLYVATLGTKLLCIVAIHAAAIYSCIARHSYNIDIAIAIIIIAIVWRKFLMVQNFDKSGLGKV